MYVLLTGTKKNAGDFLIAHSAKRLFRQYAPDPDHIEFPSWVTLDDHIEQINSSKALILCGGPAYQPTIGKNIYPFLQILDRIKVPIISFGLGWKGIPGDDYDVAHYRFPEKANPLLERLRNDFKYAGCRDYLTWRVLRRYGFKNALMTGCPAWYDPDFFNQELIPTPPTTHIVFTPAENPLFRKQSIAMMRVTNKLFPDSQIVCSFHRGWEVDEYTPRTNAENAQLLKTEAEKLGMATLDVSGGVDAMLQYNKFDIHIGYRVHAHIKLLSMRKPSFLVAEDGRGRGVLEAMGIPGVAGWMRNPFSNWCHQKKNNSAICRKVTHKLFRQTSINPNAADQLEWIIDEAMNNNFVLLKGAINSIDSTWKNMHTLLHELPK